MLQEYQQKYIRNVKAISQLMNFYHGIEDGFDSWYNRQKEAEKEISLLREENMELLSKGLFPVLDDLYETDQDIRDGLNEFADALMDWKTNLDIGVYVVIHDALLSFCRVRKDRKGIIRELYKLGMGLYYRRRIVEGIESPWADPFYFETEMVFTEAASYMRYYDEIDDKDTRGYLIRSLANIAISTRDHKRKIAASRKTLQILRDEHYRKLQPDLPWDVFLRRTHQQMSANRSQLSKGNLSREELADVLDSCYEVFKPEEEAKDPSIRWLWPYYEMEYSCGYTDLNTTLDRIEKLHMSVAEDRYDESGLYGNVQLPIYYGVLLRENPQVQKDRRRMEFLNHAYRKMLAAMLGMPAEGLGDYYYYLVDLIFTDYFEMEGVLSYREVTLALIRKLAGNRYIRSLKQGKLTAAITEAILAEEPAYFDELPVLQGMTSFAEKREVLLKYAEECGIYCDFGLIKMNMGRVMQNRELFDTEFRMYQLHTVSGYDDLRRRYSTEMFADAALGHHRWYDGSDGWPENYVRIRSPYRRMTDIAAIVTALTEDDGRDADTKLQEIIKYEGRRFSPIVTAYLSDRSLLEKLNAILEEDDRTDYLSVYNKMTDRS